MMIAALAGAATPVAQLLALLASQLWSTCALLAVLPSVLFQSALGSMGMQAKIQHNGAIMYEGYVMHDRRRPVEHSFRYPVRMALIALDAPPKWWHAQAQHHLSAAEARSMASTDGPVHCLTHPKAAGYIQNPISVYYCRCAAGLLRVCIAEVTNTPWAQRVTFLFRPAGERVPKALHVSPLMDMDSTWTLRASEPGERLRVTVSAGDHPELRNFFVASLDAAACTGPARSKRNEEADLGTLWRYGFQPQRVAVWIYWHAALLLLKGVPFHGPPSWQGLRDAAGRTKNPRMSCGSAFAWQDAQAWPWRAAGCCSQQ